MFAYDCVIFCRAIKRAAREYKSNLDHYCQVSGQLINFHKSTFTFSIGVQKGVKVEIVDTLQIQNTSFLGSYLGCSGIG